MEKKKTIQKIGRGDEKLKICRKKEIYRNKGGGTKSYSKLCQKMNIPEDVYADIRIQLFMLNEG